MAIDDPTKLLTGARADERSKSALALYEGVGEDDLVDEEIDERILKLLGLDDVFDIDYGTYISLLKEKLAASRNFDKKLSVEEDELLVSEFRRVKGKVGRFKLKKKKITSETIGTTGPIQISRDKFFLATKAIVPVTPTATEESSKDIKDIEKALDDILKSLTLQNNEKKKRSENERKKLEDRRRGKRESDLEKPLTQLKSLAKKIIAPAQGILDRIFRFIKFTLLGYAFNQLVKWFSDPKNADKIKVLGRFLKDWWPALAFAAGLFLTPLGKFVRTTLILLRSWIPRIAGFLVKNPWIAGAALMTTAGVVGIQQRKQKEEALFPEKDKQGKPIQKTTQQRVSEVQKKAFIQIGDPMGAGPIGSTFSGGGVVKRRSFFGGGRVDNIIDAKDISFEGGGGIANDSGVRIKGAGSDTQLIAAQPGEIVMSKKAVDKHGANFFLGLNKRAGGTNIPKMSNNIQLAAGGGLIKRTIKSFQGGGMIGGKYPTKIPSVSGNSMSFARNQFNSNSLKSSDTQTQKISIPSLAGHSNNTFSSPRTYSSTNNTRKPKVSFISLSTPSSDSPSKATNQSLNINQNKQIIKNYINSNSSQSFSGSISDSLSFEQKIINFATKQKSVAPGPPVLISRTTYTVLPPIKTSKKEPSIPRGSKLPEFIVSSNNDSRSNIAMKLGIADLVGVS